MDLRHVFGKAKHIELRGKTALFTLTFPLSVRLPLILFTHTSSRLTLIASLCLSKSSECRRRSRWNHIYVGSCSPPINPASLSSTTKARLFSTHMYTPRRALRNTVPPRPPTQVIGRLKEEEVKMSIAPLSTVQIDALVYWKKRSGLGLSRAGPSNQDQRRNTQVQQPLHICDTPIGHVQADCLAGRRESNLKGFRGRRDILTDLARSRSRDSRLPNRLPDTRSVFTPWRGDRLTAGVCASAIERFAV
ncbi:hypothetical protein BDZ89DRAFT_1059119 [Hymenopellis radicata]|nr:hypothetical protein BDZ89DRAFT_1059119 [Hymenopellis radicata]